jgi:hypothetical protein
MDERFYVTAVYDRRNVAYNIMRANDAAPDDLIDTIEDRRCAEAICREYRTGRRSPITRKSRPRVAR